MADEKETGDDTELDEGKNKPTPKTGEGGTPRPSEVISKEYVRRLRKAEERNDFLENALNELTGKVDAQNEELAKFRETPVNPGKKTEPEQKGIVAGIVDDIKNFLTS